MPSNVASRYQTTYRDDEIRLIVSSAARGESLGFMGLAGVGKSNMVNFLRNIQQHAPHFEQDVATLHFPVVDATYWQRNPAHLWRLMLDALTRVTQSLTLSPVEENKVISISEEERVLAALQTRLHQVCQELEHKVMFILDDFDLVFETGPLTLLERLSGLRSEGNRGFLSYLVFTKRLPHVLGRPYDLENRSKFYDLFRHHIYALEPYSPEDARQMLVHVNENAGKPLRSLDLTQIRQLAGGHGQLLKIIFDLFANEGMPVGDPVTYLANKPDVQQECQRILRNLHDEEQAVAVRLARGLQDDKDRPVMDHLVRRGLLVKFEPVTWFSPVWEQFLKNYRME
jgi:hypothetical protein